MIKIKIDEEFVCDGFKFVFHKVDGKLSFKNLGPSRGGKKEFVPPTVEEVKVFFEAEGYDLETAEKAYKHYALADWHNSKGKPVLNWKQTMNTNWFKPENKIKKVAQPQIQDSEFRF